MKVVWVITCEVCDATLPMNPDQVETLERWRSDVVPRFAVPKHDTPGHSGDESPGSFVTASEAWWLDAASAALAGWTNAREDS